MNSMKILTICLGNICRSPLAEGILKSKLNSDFYVDSAGTISLHQGENPDPRAIKTAANHGLDISKQTSRPITTDDFEVFDKIYCMDVDVFNEVSSRAKNAQQRAKVSFFLESDGITVNMREVPDPYWGSLDDFESVYELIDRESEKIASQLIQNK